MILGLILSAIPMLGFAVWGIALQFRREPERTADQHWYESGIGTQAGGIHSISD